MDKSNRNRKGDKGRRKRRSFEAAFKAEAVRLCKVGDRSIAQVAVDLDLTEAALDRLASWAATERPLCNQRWAELSAHYFDDARAQLCDGDDCAPGYTNAATRCAIDLQNGEATCAHLSCGVEPQAR